MCTSYHAVPSQEIVFQKLVVSMTKEGDDFLDHLGPFFLSPPPSINTATAQAESHPAEGKSRSKKLKKEEGEEGAG